MTPQDLTPGQVLPSPPQTPHRSNFIPELGTPSQPAQVEPSPPHKPHSSTINSENGIRSMWVSVFK